MSDHRVRPTLRALREDLDLPLPPVDVLLDQIRHPLLDKASEQFADPATGHERIAAIDDTVLFKVKVQRWRGAVWLDAPAADVYAWLVAPEPAKQARRRTSTPHLPPTPRQLAPGTTPPTARR